MALGTIEHTADTAISTVPTQDRHIPEQEPALPTPENWQDERMYASLDIPQHWDTKETMQAPTLEQVDHTETIDQLTSLVRLQIVDTDIGQLMIQLELLEMIERLQTALIQQIPAQQENRQNNS